MKRNITLFKLLCMDLGYEVARIPSLFELSVAKNYLLQWAETSENGIYEAIQEWLSSWSSPKDLTNRQEFADLYQIVSFQLKTKTETTKQQEESYIKGFLAIEHENSNYALDKDSNVLRLARYLINCNPETLDLSYLTVLKFARHGPGACYEGYALDDKSFGLLRYDYDQLRGFIPPDWSLAVPGTLGDYYHYQSLTQRHKYIVARLACVPKTFKGPRGVFVSPTAGIFLQLGCDGALRQWYTAPRNWFNQCWIPESQSQNQEAAMVGSYAKLWSTLDLKDASDRITLKLIRYLFNRSQYKALAATRPAFVELPCGSTRRLSMLSPMGDGKTFAVLTVVCTAISLASILDAEGYSLSNVPSRNVVKRLASRLRVFGDDVAVYSQYYSAVCCGLAEAGLVVNKTKSFDRGYFRESCGIDAYHGVDITPIKQKVNLDGDIRDGKSMTALIEMHNRLAYRYPQLNRVKAYLRILLKKYLPHIGWTSDFVREPNLLWEPDTTLVYYRNMRDNNRMRMIGYDLQVLSPRFVEPCQNIYDNSNDWYRYNYAMMPGAALRRVGGDDAFSKSLPQVARVMDRDRKSVV